nr:RNA 2',3'-cyclic phosphodiesterase [Desulfobacterales bacterium]
MTQEIRTFIAVELPEHVLVEIRKVQAALKRHNLNIRWVLTENIHLTLKFLGDVAQSEIGRILETIEKATDNLKRFSLYGKGIGVFPGPHRPQVIWVGVKGEIDVLEGLQARLENGMESLGFAREHRPFTPHLTLGRVKGRLNRALLLKAMEELNDFQTKPFSVDSVVLFRSVLKPDGVVYTKLSEVLLEQHEQQQA